MRKIIFIGLCLIMGLSSCKKDKGSSPIKVQATDISIENTEVSLIEGEVFKLYVSVSPNNATTNDIEFHSENCSIASVSKTGVINALSVGKTSIIVSLNGKTDKIIVSVENEFTVPKSIIGKWIGFEIELIDKNGTRYNEQGICDGWWNELTKEEQETNIKQLRALYSYVVESPNIIKFGLAVSDDGKDNVSYMYGDGVLNSKRGNSRVFTAIFNLDNFDVKDWSAEPFKIQEIVLQTDNTLIIQTQMGENKFICHYKVM